MTNVMVFILFVVGGWLGWIGVDSAGHGDRAWLWETVDLIGFFLLPIARFSCDCGAGDIPIGTNIACWQTKKATLCQKMANKWQFPR